MISTTACTVSGFGGLFEGGYEDPPYYGFISGANYVYHNNDNTDFTWSSYSYNCPGNIEIYDWEISYDGGRQYWDFPVNDEPTATLRGEDVPLNVPIIFVRLKSKCFETQEEFVKVYRVVNWSAQNLQEENHAALRSSIHEHGRGHWVYPNPADQEINIQFQLDEKSSVMINLISPKGEVNHLYQSNLAAELHQLRLDISAFTNGYYLLELHSQGKSFFTPLTIIK